MLIVVKCYLIIINKNRNLTLRFHLNIKEILEILTADDSGDESDIALDEEDQAFLECDLDNATKFISEG